LAAAAHDAGPLSPRRAMADIFLSYNEKDRDAVRRLAETLQSTGWSVWWDRRIPAGLTWRGVLERELQHMRCMVVLWSQHSVASEWVCEEAAEGRQLGRLVPVLIEHVRPPRGFREIQAADLVDWDGSHDFLGLRRLLEDIEALIGKPGAAVPTTPEPALAGAAPGPVAPEPQSFPWGMSALLVAIAIGAYYGTVARRSPELRNDAPQGSAKPVPPVPKPQAFDAASAAPFAAAVPASAPSNKAASASLPAASRPAPSASSIMARCAALRERLALGESVSSVSQGFFRQECMK
ncbi:MAG: toll/interleukin-1 receptor domain-containing protein, partial [Burkholderiaceae bacterium]